MRILAIGEVMIELSGAGHDARGAPLWRQGLAGDTFNTAWYLAALRPDWQIGYATRLGQDAMSEQAFTAIAAAGLETSAISRDPQRSIGLYMISLVDGERSFSYWRSHAAARMMAEDPAWLAQIMTPAEVIYLSGITLAILAPEARARLLEALRGRRVVFDPNIRPRLWESDSAMRDWISQAAALSQIVLPSFDDEAAAFGDADLPATLARYRSLGVAEIVIKNGAGPLMAWSEGQALQLPAPANITARDTTGAGDSFNAGYLSARLGGADLVQSVLAGQKLSALVVQHPGALLPRPILQDAVAAMAEALLSA